MAVNCDDCDKLIVLNVALNNTDGAVPLLSQAQVVVLNTKLSQQFTTGGCTGWVPVLSQAQLVVLNW